MSKLFMSHSSKDKPFVIKLAMDLVAKGFPVWFDNWEIEAGDSLIQKIYTGIDSSSYLIVVLSSSSVESKWVLKELTAALVKEEQIGHRFVIPIKIDDCHVPLSIADRLYADFSHSYLGALEKLGSIFSKLNINEDINLPEHRLVPVTFSHGLYLREVPFEERVTSILSTNKPSFEFSDKQFILSFDETYTKLRERMVQRMEGIESDPFYSPEFERSFSQYYKNVLTLEKQLIEGITLILNEVAVKKRINMSDSISACHWYSRITRTKLYGILHSCQRPDSDDIIQAKAEWSINPLGINHNAASFFGVPEVDTIDISELQSPSVYIHVWVDSQCEMLKDWRRYQSTLRLKDYLHSEIVCKYIIPQMVNLHLINPVNPLLWDFQRYNVEPS